MSAPKPEVWTVAVCLYNYNTSLDFAGPVEIFGFLDPVRFPKIAFLFEKEGPESIPKVALDVHYLSVNLDPVIPDAGPRLVPTDLYSTEKQYDVILVPGGKFLKKHMSGLK